MKLEIGDKIIIDEIRMTCTSIKIQFEGISYHMIYFDHGALHEYNFHERELDILGAVKVGGLKDKGGRKGRG